MSPRERTDHSVRQARAVARSDVLLALGATAVGMVGLAVDSSWLPQLAFPIAALMAVSAAFEWWVARRGSRRLAQAPPSVPTPIRADPSAPLDLPLRAYRLEDRDTFGTTVVIHGSVVYVDGGQHAHDAATLAAMEAVVTDPEAVQRAFTAFLEEEIARVPPASRYAEDIRSELRELRLSMLAFHYVEPEADVYLASGEGEDEVYSCRYRDGRFFDLEPRPITE